MPAPYRKRVALAIGLVLALLVAAVLVAELRTPGVEFDRAAWFDPAHRTNNVRLRLADRLIATRALLGKTRAEVIAMLGEPPATGYFSEWDLVYWLGDERAWISIDSEWLVIRFSSDGVVVANRIVHD